MWGKGLSVHRSYRNSEQGPSHFKVTCALACLIELLEPKCLLTYSKVRYK